MLNPGFLTYHQNNPFIACIVRESITLTSLSSLQRAKGKGQSLGIY